jgi:hypothetical protein
MAQDKALGVRGHDWLQHVCNHLTTKCPIYDAINALHAITLAPLNNTGVNPRQSAKFGCIIGTKMHALILPTFITTKTYLGLLLLMSCIRLGHSL